MEKLDANTEEQRRVKEQRKCAYCRSKKLLCGVALQPQQAVSVALSAEMFRERFS